MEVHYTGLKIPGMQKELNIHQHNSTSTLYFDGHLVTNNILFFLFGLPQAKSLQNIPVMTIQVSSFFFFI